MYNLGIEEQSISFYGIILTMAHKGKISVDSEDEIREIEKELEEELRYAVASAKGIVPADAVIKIERKLGRPTGVMPP